MTECNVSVIVPYYNDSKSVIRCIKSIFEQSFKPLEVIVIDDCSNDSDLLLSILNDYPDVIYKRNNVNLNGAYCRNLGVSLASCKYVAFLDADDYWSVDHIQKNFEHITANDCDFLYSNVISVNRNGEQTLRKVNDHRVYNGHYCNLLLMSPPQTNSFFAKRNVLLSVRFDEKLKRHQDYQLYLDVLHSRYKCCYLDIYTSYHCVSPRSLQSRYDFASALSFWVKYESEVSYPLYMNYLWLSLFLSFKTNGNVDSVIESLYRYSGIKIYNSFYGKIITYIYFNFRYRFVTRLQRLLNV